MAPVPNDLRDRLHEHGQDHALADWDRLTEAQRQDLVAQLAAIDFAELARLYAQRDAHVAGLDASRIAPLPRPDADPAHLAADRKCGEEAYRAGQVAFLVVAGGQGTRLGFDRAKGIFPVGPISGKSLFQVIAEKVLAVRRRHRQDLPLLVMTSPATDAETRAYFAENGRFGLSADAVRFFCQGTMPALDLATGRLLLEGPGQLFLSPNGHGGTLTGLADSGLLGTLEERGCRTVYYFQVDNPLVDLADYGFVGRHLAADAEVTSKVIAKDDPTEKVGNFALIDGRCAMIEYSDLGAELARSTDAQGRLRLWAGNPAIHLFDVGFLRRVTGDADKMPWHLARKAVPFWDGRQMVKPAAPNALKFERFIFDVLPVAERWAVVTTTKAKEFAPLKNKDGVDSPATVRQGIIGQAADWLEQAGASVPRDADGAPRHALEVSPLFALDAAELAAKVRPGERIDGPRYFE